MYTENIVPIVEVVENIYLVFGDELKWCNKVELELRANVGVNKYLLDNMRDNILKQLSSEVVTNSSCKIFYTDINIAKDMCEYRIRIFDKDTSC